MKKFLNSVALAAVAPTPIVPIPKGTQLNTVILNVATWILWLAGTLAFIYLVYGGIIYITAAGNEDRTKAGKSAIMSSIIGIIIILAAYAIVLWLRKLLTP